MDVDFYNAQIDTPSSMQSKPDYSGGTRTAGLTQDQLTRVASLRSAFKINPSESLVFNRYSRSTRAIVSNRNSIRTFYCDAGFDDLPEHL